MHFVVVPLRKLRRRQSFPVECAQQLKRPTPALVFDVRDEIVRKQTRARHLSQFKKGAEQSGFSTGKYEPVAIWRRVDLTRQFQQRVPGRSGKYEPVAIWRRVDLTRQFQQRVPGRGWCSDQVGPEMQQPDIDVARNAVQ